MMKTIIIICIAATLSILTVAAQTTTENELAYRAEMQGTAADGYTPFWMVSNRYGLVPLEASNSYLSAGGFYSGRKGNFRWGAGIDMALVEPRYKSVLLRQVYGEAAFRGLHLMIGSKEEYVSLWDRELSSGDMVLSANARPIPQIRLSIPDYVGVLGAGWLQMRGAFVAGRSFDKDYLRYAVNGNVTYVDDILWHYKSLHFRFKDRQASFPLSFELGFQHGAQWGGTSTNPRIGKQPQSLSDYIRVIFGMSGDEQATVSDQINVLGNQYGSYDLRLGYSASDWAAHVYHQRYFEDKSGMEFINGLDGLWGVQLDAPAAFPWIRKAVFEILETRHQTGPFHFIEFDHNAHPGIGGGNDNYYNNGEYSTGLSYFNRSVGSPLLSSPEYNDNEVLGFPDTRVHNLHFAVSGDISGEFSYRLLLTSMETWGSHHRPYLNTKTGISGLCEVSYRPARLKGWTFTAMLAGDKGDYLRKKGVGGGLIISKRGILAIGRSR
ncbi:MAG: capsule assembly Wzi family protein [Tannerellaceae bacterium]|jgi:hypothetical protein|nr:capsule assembly Wzi family protein [Tannerellaceae bacterium]